MILEFSRVRANARTPVRANPSDAGLDIFYCPETPQSVVLRTNENKILPTGLKFGVPHGYMLQVMNILYQHQEVVEITMAFLLQTITMAIFIFIQAVQEIQVIYILIQITILTT